MSLHEKEEFRSTPDQIPPQVIESAWLLAEAERLKLSVDDLEGRAQDLHNQLDEEFNQEVQQLIEIQGSITPDEFEARYQAALLKLDHNAQPVIKFTQMRALKDLLLPGVFFSTNRDQLVTVATPKESTDFVSEFILSQPESSRPRLAIEVKIEEREEPLVIADTIPATIGKDAIVKQLDERRFSDSDGATDSVSYRLQTVLMYEKIGEHEKAARLKADTLDLVWRLLNTILNHRELGYEDERKLGSLLSMLTYIDESEYEAFLDEIRKKSALGNAKELVAYVIAHDASKIAMDNARQKNLDKYTPASQLDIALHHVTFVQSGMALLAEEDKK
jgi:hypothetical protein